LPYSCAIRSVAAAGDILDPDRDDIAATKLAVYRQIEHSQIASAALDLEFRSDRPDVLGSQRRLCPGQLSLVPRHSAGRGGSIHLILHGHTPRLGYRVDKHEPQVFASKSGQVRSRTKADFAAGPAKNSEGSSASQDRGGGRFSFIHDRVAELYSPDNGRPPLDPTLMFKASFVGYLLL
jgi:hypothetical protein